MAEATYRLPLAQVPLPRAISMVVADLTDGAARAGGSEAEQAVWARVSRAAPMRDLRVIGAAGVPMPDWFTAPLPTVQRIEVP